MANSLSGNRDKNDVPMEMKSQVVAAKLNGNLHTVGFWEIYLEFVVGSQCSTEVFIWCSTRGRATLSTHLQFTDYSLLSIKIKPDR